ncbi:exopolysaccharide biosynthesis polyprenyl glycosylphosphotransferase [Paenibacillus catalpae]|uniref:Exopolysaccharide biosynthesis polyprenyl glycosylphosphotransferase n=1 Tax=Paenibacillus catalpae TaxID=1045775 RepID=A0A1I2DUW4_9BACL|nr:exopolysaccharide biosynthesis polyprenyl glycosylphosphotransferase [Paenibacillus catalpae]
MALSPLRKESEMTIDGHLTLVNKAQAQTRNSKRTYLMVKRMMDLVGAAIGLILLSPLLLTVALLIKLENPKAPVFFYQNRVGINEKLFRMYKFRSMVPNAEDLLTELLHKNEIEGHMFKMKHDPRITAIGRFIRRTSIDELPQLWNVVRGNMSLVGPRPPLPREVAEYSSYDKLRLRVKPGCTGLWQVSGRNELSFSEMVELDLEYIEKRNVWFDLKILAKTAKAMVGSDDAY